MDEIRCLIEVREDDGKPRLVGTLMPYGTRAKDRAEVFEVGSLNGTRLGSCLTGSTKGPPQFFVFTLKSAMAAWSLMRRSQTPRQAATRWPRFAPVCFVG